MDLALWKLSLRQKLDQNGFAVKLIEQIIDDHDKISSPSPENLRDIPLATIYGIHVYHCLQVLLHGKMDYIHMYEDNRWISSPDFLKVGFHSGRCAKVFCACIWLIC